MGNLFHLILGKQSVVQAEALDGSTDPMWCCLGSKAISDGFSQSGCIFVPSYLTCVSVTGGCSCWATVFIALRRNSEKSPVIISKPIKKLRCFHFLDQSPMEIKEQPCCTFKKDHPALLFPQTFILTSLVFFYIFSMLDYEASFISFHLFLTFRNSEEHPSKLSNRPIFKVFLFFLFCCLRKSVSAQVFQRHSQFMAHNRVKTSALFQQRVLSYFLSVAEYPQALGLKKFWISFLQHVVVITVFYVLVVGCLERKISRPYFTLS